MISDVLAEATGEIAGYLHSELYDEVYSGPLRAWIIALCGEMEALRNVLDTVPEGL